VVALESGLEGSLARRLANVRTPVTQVEASPGQLSALTREWMESHAANAAVAVALYASEAERVIEQILITPEGEQSRRLTYGGPPKYAARWAVNLALNWLRQTANKHDTQ